MTVWWTRVMWLGLHDCVVGTSGRGCEGLACRVVGGPGSMPAMSEDQEGRTPQKVL